MIEVKAMKGIQRREENQSVETQLPVRHEPVPYPQN